MQVIAPNFRHGRLEGGGGTISIFLISMQVIAPNFRHGRLEGGGGTEK